MQGRILTKNPDKDRIGRNIAKERYDKVRTAIINCLKAKKEPTHTTLLDQVTKRLKGKFIGSIEWYMQTVKRDLEARKIIERTRDKPQRYRLLSK